jgi:hypothetical protein
MNTLHRRKRTSRRRGDRKVLTRHAIRMNHTYTEPSSKRDIQSSLFITSLLSRRVRLFLLLRLFSCSDYLSVVIEIILSIKSEQELSLRHS